MNAVKATFTNGQIIPSEPVDWPEGTQLVVEPLSKEGAVEILAVEWPTDSLGIARHLALMDQIEPLEMSALEEAEWKEALRAQKELELAHWEVRSRQIERLFE